MGDISVSNGKWALRIPSWLAVTIIGVMFALIGAWATNVTVKLDQALTRAEAEVYYASNSDLQRMKAEIINEIRSLERAVVRNENGR